MLEFFAFNFQKFMLVFSRIMGLVFIVPFFSSETITDQAKLGVCFFITAVIFPLVYPHLPPIPTSMIEYVLLAIIEGLIGVIIGFCINISFAVYQLAGQYFTVQMGFGASEVFDPFSEVSLPLMGQYLYLLAILVFLSLNGPLMIINEIYLSFEMIKTASFIKDSVMLETFGLVASFIKMFVIAMKISLPIIGALLLTTVAMGLLSKAAPQMNLLMIGFPISIAVGFIILLFILPDLISYFGDYMDEMFKDVWNLMSELRQ